MTVKYLLRKDFGVSASTPLPPATPKLPEAATLGQKVVVSMAPPAPVPAPRQIPTPAPPAPVKTPQPKYVMKQPDNTPAESSKAPMIATSKTPIHFANAPVFVNPGYAKMNPALKTTLDRATQGLSVPKGFFLGVVGHESGGFNPRATRVDPGGSAGRGLGQLTEGGAANKPGFWADYARRNLGISHFDFFNPEHNAKVSAHYLNNLYNSYGRNAWLAAVAYNQGGRGVNNTLKMAGITPDKYSRLSYKDVMNIMKRTKNDSGVNYLNAISKWTGT